MLPWYAYLVLACGWLVWFVPFLFAQIKRPVAATLDPRARWGMLLQAIAYSILWQNRFWERPLPAWRLILAIALFLLAALLSWTSTRALGRQWRMDAGLLADHELVTSGPYRMLRHPIYCSMLCTLLGTGFLLTPLLMILLASLVFIAGVEIRVRIEDKLLASRFGDRFDEYRRRVPAYIPFVR